MKMGTGRYEQDMKDIQGQGGYLAVQPGGVFATDKKQGGMRRMLDWLFFFYFFFIFYFWLCQVFISVRGLSLVAASGGHSSSWCAGLSLSRPLLLRSTDSRYAGSVVVAHGPSCSAACGIFPDQGSNPCPLHWKADSQPLRHQGGFAFNETFGRIVNYFIGTWYGRRESPGFGSDQVCWSGHLKGLLLLTLLIESNLGFWEVQYLNE